MALGIPECLVLLFQLVLLLVEELVVLLNLLSKLLVVLAEGLLQLADLLLELVEFAGGDYGDGVLGVLVVAPGYRFRFFGMLAVSLGVLFDDCARLEYHLAH